MISIVVANYNKQDYVSSCLDSLVNQVTKVQYEIILIDDGSTDNSRTIIHNFITSYPGSVPIKYFQHKHSGKIKSFNFGVDRANGSFVKLFGSDDVALPIMIDDLAKNARNDSILLHNCTISDSDCVTLKNKLLNISDSLFNISIKSVIKGKSFPSGNYLIPSEFTNLIFPIHETASYEDWYIAMKIAINQLPINSLSKSLFIYRQVNNGNWGGIFNFSLKALKYRAKRDLCLIRLFESMLGQEYLFHLQKKEYELTEITKFSIFTFIFKKIDVSVKMKIYCKIILSSLKKYR